MNLFTLSFSIYFSIYIYVLTLIFFLIYLYMVNFYNQINNSLKLNLIDSEFSVKLNFFLFLGSLIGIPPLMGFFGKLIMFINLIIFQKYLFTIIFFLLNLFLLIFYLQQIRFIQTNKKKKVFFQSNPNLTFNLCFLTTLFQFLNILSIVFIPYFFEFFILCSI